MFRSRRAVAPSAPPRSLNVLMRHSHRHVLALGTGDERRIPLTAQTTGASKTNSLAQSRAACRRPRQGRLDARGRHPARHVPALLLRPKPTNYRDEKSRDQAIGSRQRGGRGAIRKSGSTPCTRTEPEQGNRIDPESVGRLSNCGNHSGSARKQLNQLRFSVSSGGYVSA